jgi:O-antigen ligase
VAVSFVGVLVTFSRSGILFSTALTVAYILLPQGRGTMAGGQRSLVLVAGAILAAAGIAATLNFADLSESASSRLISILTSDYSDGSATGRLDAAIYGLEKFSENFWFGLGLGSTDIYHVNAHNSFIHIGVEYGIIGVLVYIAILVAGLLKIIEYGWRQAINLSLLAGYVFYASLFDHGVYLEYQFAIAFAAIMVDALVPRVSKPQPSPTELRSFADHQ